jgi:hypothetical protein
MLARRVIAPTMSMQTVTAMSIAKPTRVGRHARRMVGKDRRTNDRRAGNLRGRSVAPEDRAIPGNLTAVTRTANGVINGLTATIGPGVAATRKPEVNQADGEAVVGAVSSGGVNGVGLG